MPLRDERRHLPFSMVRVCPSCRTSLILHSSSAVNTTSHCNEIFRQISSGRGKNVSLSLVSSLNAGIDCFGLFRLGPILRGAFGVGFLLALRGLASLSRALTKDSSALFGGASWGELVEFGLEDLSTSEMVFESISSSLVSCFPDVSISRNGPFSFLSDSSLL